MTDQQLIEALRRLDTPAQPRGQFRDDLYSKLMATGAVRNHRSRGFVGGPPTVIGRNALRVAVAGLAIVVAVVAFGIWSNLPTVGPSVSPSPSPSASASPTPIQSEQGQSGGLVAYSVCSHDPENSENCIDDPRIWVANANGTGDHELLPAVSGAQLPVAWTPDGSRLLIALGSSDRQLSQLAWTDVAGTAPDLIRSESLCPAGVANCSVSPLSAQISSDGTRLAYAVFEGSGQDRANGLIAVFEFASGAVTRIEASLIPGPFKCCDGYYKPSWSADSTRLAFGLPALASYTVKIDGTDLRRLLPADVFGTAPLWSPDGSTILTVVCGTEPQIHVVDPDGGNLRTLTDTCSEPRWTRDARIVFGPAGAGHQVVSTWVMDADGGNAHEIGNTIAALTAAGCITCTLRDPDGKSITVGYWQPRLEGAP